jgi:hypothetical protein
MLSILMLLTLSVGTAERLVAHYVPTPGMNTLETYTPRNFWSTDSWVSNNSLNIDSSSGQVRIATNGIYLVYATFTFHDLAGRWGTTLQVSNKDVALCFATEQFHRKQSLEDYHPTSHGVYHQCHITLTTRLRRGDTLVFADSYPGRLVMTHPKCTMWGIVKL